MKKEAIKLARDCPATQIPSGQKTLLPKGTQVILTQSLGGSFTVMLEDGYMVQIAGEDGDALGKEPLKAETKTEGKSLEELVWDQLRTCYDPEIPVNIVDLGLVYKCVVVPTPEEGKHRVHVQMTLTAPGCGMGASIASDARAKIESLAGIKDANVELVMEPAWDRSMMSDAAKLQLGMM